MWTLLKSEPNKTPNYSQIFFKEFLSTGNALLNIQSFREKKINRCFGPNFIALFLYCILPLHLPFPERHRTNQGVPLHCWHSQPAVGYHMDLGWHQKVSLGV